ncbi:MAG: N-acetyltransferase, partial [Treponema sp.]|nr:N-acetyltransferase [Treponema sp.]
MIYRKATVADLTEICALVVAAIAEMERNGIPQWDEIYPTREDFLNDIKTGCLFAGEVSDNGEKRIAVIYALNKECDEEYKNGDWKYDGDFRVVHRLCVH